VAGILLLGYFVFQAARRKLSIRFHISLFELLFLAGSIFFFSLLLRCNLIHYDNFSNWAIVLKQMLSTYTFPTASSDLIDYKNYPLGTASFLYYVCRFVGHAQAIMITAQDVLIFACFYALFGIISEKKRFLLYAFLALGCSILSIFNITIRIDNLLVDFLLPIYSLVLFVVVYRYRTDIKKACIAVIPIAGFLTIIKDTGIIFAGIGLIYLAYIWITYRVKPRWKSGLSVLCTLVASLLPYLGWSWHVAVAFQRVKNKFSVSVGDIRIAKTPGEVYTIISLFIHSVFALSSQPTMGIVAFNIAAVAASIFAAVSLKRKWHLWKALITLDGVLILYYLGILGLYIFSMPLSEALQLAGFDRYASSIVVLFAGGLVLCATVDMENSFFYKVGEVPGYRAFKDVNSKHRYQEGIIVCLAVSVALLMSEYNGLLSIQLAYSATLPYKVSAVTGDRWYDSGKEDKSRYLFYAPDEDQQVTDYYLQYIGKYFLYAPHVDGVCLFYEDNMNHLLSGYNYLVVVESDPDEIRLLKKHYDVSGQNGIYKIASLDGQVSLSLVQP